MPDEPANQAPSSERLSDAELIDKGFEILTDWIVPGSEMDDREAILRLIELYEKSGREFVRIVGYIDPANEG